ncbi:Zinc finger protein 177-like [Homarus americanus]|uniref:Zinc finger protein 177-like n=1 Tax=Homarus americanus TaxID=6706 RepID=A0A8J5JCK3_HOMAM|nr:Zinc finger protein 177-like [Homarus americanus]
MTMSLPQQVSVPSMSVAVTVSVAVPGVHVSVPALNVAGKDDQMNVYFWNKSQENQDAKPQVTGEVYEKRTPFDLHMMQHRGEKPLECDVCGKLFQYRSTLDLHRKTHFKEKVFKCDICGEEFTGKVLLRKHIKHVHTERYFAKRFAGWMGENKNTKSHGDSKPLRCDQCSLLFKDNSKFLLHQKVHRPEKNFKCEVCGMAFAKSYTLEVHQQMHPHVAPLVGTATLTEIPCQGIPTTSTGVMTLTPLYPVTHQAPVVTSETPLVQPPPVVMPGTSKLPTYVKVPMRPIVVKGKRNKQW